jgi:hypothetical protein
VSEQTTALQVATTTEVATKKTLDDVLALLRVSESAGEGREQAEEGANNTPSVPWIGYRTNKSKAKLEELLAAGVADGNFYVYDKGVIYPKPFFIHLIAAFRFFSKVDKNNKIIGLAATNTPARKKEWYSDHILGLALVRMPGETPIFKAATFGLRKAMTRAVDDLRIVVTAFEKDKVGREWAVRGKAHADAIAAAKWPTFAVRARIWSKLEPSKTGGDDYNIGLSALEPTPVSEVHALNRYMGLEAETYGGEAKKTTDFANALRVFGMRRAEVLQKIQKQEAAEGEAA